MKRRGCGRACIERLKGSIGSIGSIGLVFIALLIAPRRIVLGARSRTKRPMESLSLRTSFEHWPSTVLAGRLSLVDYANILP